MKKKLLIAVYLLLVFGTAIVFLAGAVESYRYDMDPAYGVDILEGFGAALLLALGVLIILCETDLFFTVYYFLVKPKTTGKTVFMILSQLLLPLVIFSERLADFLSRNISDVFREETIIVVPIFLLYIVLRLICVAVCFSEK